MLNLTTPDILAKKIASCTNMKEILSLYGKFVHEECGAVAGYAFTFSYGRYGDPALLEPLYSSFPESILDFYTTNACVLIDPVVRGALRTHRPIKYHDYFAQMEAQPEMDEVLRMLRANGIVDGVSMQVSGFPGRLTYVSLAYGHCVADFSDADLMRMKARVEMFIRHGSSLADSPTAQHIKHRLSKKERQVIRRLAKGSSNKEIALALEISPSTVNTLLTRSFEKLGASTRTEAAIAASRHGLGFVA